MKRPKISLAPDEKDEKKRKFETSPTCSPVLLGIVVMLEATLQVRL